MLLLPPIKLFIFSFHKRCSNIFSIFGVVYCGAGLRDKQAQMSAMWAERSKYTSLGKKNNLGSTSKRSIYLVVNVLFKGER